MEDHILKLSTFYLILCYYCLYGLLNCDKYLLFKTTMMIGQDLKAKFHYLKVSQDAKVQ